MTDIVTRLRDWRNVHLARLHILMEEAADQIAILESKLSLRANLEAGLIAGVVRLQDEVRRLRNGALEARGTVSQNGDFPEPENVANEDNTPATHATPGDGIEQDRCTLTDEVRRLRGAITALADQAATLSVCNGNVTVTMDATLTVEEREAVERARIAFRDMDHNAMTMQQLEDYEAICGLLERLGGGDE